MVNGSTDIPPHPLLPPPKKKGRGEDVKPYRYIFVHQYSSMLELTKPGSYGAVSVYGPQIFSLLGFDTETAEYLTQGNYVSYLFLMTFAWILIDAVGRRKLLLGGSAALTVSFFLLTAFGGLAFNAENLGISNLGPAIPGIITLYLATGAFGIGWLATVWVSSPSNLLVLS